MSIVSEVERITKQYNGLLLQGAFSHLTLQGYEQDLKERLSSNGAVKVISKSGATLLMYSLRYLFRGQFLLYVPAVADDFEVLCIALFTANRQTDSLDFSKFCIITRAEWDKATVTKKEYRSFNMLKLPTLDLMSQTRSPLLPNVSLRQSLVYSSDSISATLDENDDEEGGGGGAQECQATDVHASQFRLFWLHEALLNEKEEEDDDEKDMIEEKAAIPEDNEYLRHYTAFLIDVLVWQRYFKEYDASLKKSMLRYYASVIGDHHSEMTILFISQMIIHSSTQLSNRVHQARKDAVRYGDWFIELCETRFYREWLDAEVFLFKNAHWHKDLATQVLEIQEHVAFISACLPASLQNNWVHYNVVLPDNNKLFYWRQISTNSYQISVNWLFKREFGELLQTLEMEDGYTIITTQIFQTVFMPLLYKCMLEDVYRALFYLHHQNPGATFEEGEVRRVLIKLRDRFHYKWETMEELQACLEECRTNSATSLFDCVAALRDGNVRSPATKKMLKKRPEFDLSKERTENSDHRVPWYERVIVREDMPDIEDLGKKELAPPCMRTIFNVPSGKVGPKLGHFDKMNVVKYLIDLAYTKKEIIYFLCRGWEHEPSYMVEIANKFDSFSAEKRQNAAQINRQHHSFNCNRLINTVPIQAEKNPLRCPYADAACGDSGRRKKFEYKEKKVFMGQCGTSLKRPLLYGTEHPVQYTLAQIAATSRS